MASASSLLFSRNFIVFVSSLGRLHLASLVGLGSEWKGAGWAVLTAGLALRRFQRPYLVASIASTVLEGLEQRKVLKTVLGKGKVKI